MSPNPLARLTRPQSDQRLLALAREGDERAFEAVVRRHRRSLLRYCRRLGLSEPRAEDAVQQALLQTWLAIERGKDVHAPKAWLYRAVHNTAINVLRSSRYEQGAVEETARLALAPSAETDFEHRLALREALGELAALPSMQREAIMLTAVDGRSHEEAATALGVTHGAVRGLLYRARATLRDAAAAFVPQPLLVWAGGSLGRLAPNAARVAELSAPAGGADMGGVLAKGAALAASAAVLAAGAGVVSQQHQRHQRPKVPVLAAGVVGAQPDGPSSAVTGSSTQGHGEPFALQLTGTGASRAGHRTALHGTRALRRPGLRSLRRAPRASLDAGALDRASRGDSSGDEGALGAEGGAPAGLREPSDEASPHDGPSGPEARHSDRSHVSPGGGSPGDGTGRRSGAEGGSPDLEAQARQAPHDGGRHTDGAPAPSGPEPVAEPPS